MAKATKKSEKKFENSEPDPPNEADNLNLHPPEMESKFTPPQSEDLFSAEEENDADEQPDTAETPEQPPVSSIGPTPPSAPRPKGRPRTRPEAIMHPEIMDRLNNLESWEGIRVYVYRKEPISNRLLGPNTFTNCARYEGTFDEQDLMNELGSGVYQLRVTKVNPQNAKRTMFDSGDVRIMNMKYPPKVPKGEWLDDPRNKAWEWAREAKDPEPDPKTATPAVDPTIAMLEILKQQLQMSQEEGRALRNLILAKKPEDTTSPILAILTPLLPILIEKLTSTPKQDPAQALLIQYLMEQAKQKNEVPPPPDPEAALERTLNLLDKLESRNGGKETPRSRKTGLQELIADVAGPVSNALAPFLQVVAAGMMQKNQPQPAPQFPGAAPPPITPEVIQPGHRIQPPAPGPQLVSKTPTDQQIADAILDHLRRGVDGYDLGDWYLENFGEREFTEIRLQGRPKLYADLQRLPNTWRFLLEFTEHGELDQLLEEFFTWEPPTEDEPENPEPDTKPAPQTATAIKDGWNTPTEQETR